MNIENIKQAIQNEKASLDEAFEKTSFNKDNTKLRECWSAWEWCLVQLKAKGLDELEVKMMLQLYQSKSKRLGTYGAIQECLFGEQITLLIT